MRDIFSSTCLQKVRYTYLAAQELAEVTSCDHVFKKTSTVCVVVRQARRGLGLVNIKSTPVPFLCKLVWRLNTYQW